MTNRTATRALDPHTQIHRGAKEALHQGWTYELADADALVRGGLWLGHEERFESDNTPFFAGCPRPEALEAIASWGPHPDACEPAELAACDN